MRTATDICEDNDLFRKAMLSSSRHRVVLTSGVVGLRERDTDAFAELLRRVKTFDDFVEDNDPWIEHDFGRIELDGDVFLWKMDYYDSDWEHWADPRGGNPNLLLTIMKEEEY